MRIFGQPIALEKRNNRGQDAPLRRHALKSAFDRVNDAVATADGKAKAFASGDQSISLSDVMISLEQANLALQAAAAVRDKVIAAYTNVMNMPV